MKLDRATLSAMFADDIQVYTEYMGAVPLREGKSRCLTAWLLLPSSNRPTKKVDELSRFVCTLCRPQ